MLARLLRTMRLGFKSLFLHKLRSALAMLGILIGVTAVIWLVALGEGVSYQAQKQIQELGARNVIIKSVKPPVVGGGDRTFFLVYGLKLDDFRRFKETVPNIEAIVPMREVSREFRHEGQVLNGQLIGCTPEYFDINHLAMDRGEFLTDVMGTERKNYCVLGWEAAEKLFPLQDPLGQSVQIDLDFYKVIGVTRERAGSASIGGSMAGREYNLDIYIPFQTFRARLSDQIMTAGSGSQSGEVVEISQITVTVKDISQVEETADIIKSLLEKYHKQIDYSIVVPKELLRQAEVLRAMFNVLLVLIAGISLVVGGIGIMNIMLATVTERTREIGVRRALGARRRDIITQFLAETVVLTGTGGIMGVVMGYLCNVGVSVVRSLMQLASPELWKALPNTIQNLEPIVAPWSVGAAFIISVVVGVLFGLYPASRAAHMDPIEALRHE